MWNRKNLTVSAAALSAALLAGCGAGSTLRAPESVVSLEELKVDGYSSGFKSFKEKDLKIGSYAVTNIDRDWDKSSGVDAGPFSKDTKKKAYRFDLTSQARTLHGECTEQAVTKAIGGFGKANVDFNCVFTEGGTEYAKISVQNGVGTMQIGEGITYNVATLHEVEGGGTASSALGYEFRGAQGSGAVDLTGTGRAWLPNDVAEDEALGLVSGFAGLLLYRPTN